MSIGCLMIATNLPDRLLQTMRAILSVDRANSIHPILDKKILSIDLQPGIQGCEDDLRRNAELRGWEVVVAPCTGYRAMINNISRGLKLLTNVDILFYCEDHIIVDRLPSRRDIDVLVGGGRFGWINFNTHIYEENLLNLPTYVAPPGRDSKMEYINDLDNWISSPDGDDYLVKKPSIRDEYFLNFPAALAPRMIFEALLQYGMQHYSNIGIEIGFTRAWFDLGWSQIKEVGIYTKPGTIDRIPFASFGELHAQACIQFRNNNPDMLHESIVPHAVIPQDKNQRRSFF